MLSNSKCKASFAGEIGGYMGLLIGMSALTLFELIDLVIYYTINMVYVRWREAREQQANKRKASDSA